MINYGLEGWKIFGQADTFLDAYKMLCNISDMGIERESHILKTIEYDPREIEKCVR